MPTQQQIENLRVAYSIMAGVPADRVYLDAYRLNKVDVFREPTDDDMLNDCGTVGCVAGWLSAHPYFKSLGLRVDSLSAEITGSGYGLADKILFGSYGIFSTGPSGLLGKKFALRRIRLALLESKAITSERNAELASQESALQGWMYRLTFPNDIDGRLKVVNAQADARSEDGVASVDELHDRQ